MSSLVFLVEQVAIGVYILVAVFVLVFIFRWRQASWDVRSSRFELERSLARSKRGSAVTAVLLLVEIGLIVVGLQQVVAPTLRRTEQVNVSVALEVDDGVFATFTSAPIDSGIVINSSGVVLGEQNPADLVQPTPTITPTPVGTILPNAAPSNCTNPNVQLMIPANGMVVFEPIAVIGVASVPDFAYYRFELFGDQTSGNFATLERDYTEPVPSQGTLGQFVPAFHRPGWYQFRVAVFDLTNTMRASCTVNIYVSEPIPTPTPLGTETR